MSFLLFLCSRECLQLFFPESRARDPTSCGVSLVLWWGPGTRGSFCWGLLLWRLATEVCWEKAFWLFVEGEKGWAVMNWYSLSYLPGIIGRIVSRSEIALNRFNCAWLEGLILLYSMLLQEALRFLKVFLLPNEWGPEVVGAWDLFQWQRV